MEGRLKSDLMQVQEQLATANAALVSQGLVLAGGTQPTGLPVHTGELHRCCSSAAKIVVVSRPAACVQACWRLPLQRRCFMHMCSSQHNLLMQQVVQATCACTVLAASCSWLAGAGRGQGRAAEVRVQGAAQPRGGSAAQAAAEGS